MILHFAEIFWTSANQRVFNVSAEGSPIISALDIWRSVGANASLATTNQVTVSDGVLNLGFVTTLDAAKVSAVEIRAHAGDPFLHAVIGAPTYAVDYDGNGTENVTLTGVDSHTHELGHVITGWSWSEGSTSLGEGVSITSPLSVGSHTVTMTIRDDKSPPSTLSDAVVVPVYPPNAVAGAMARYYPTGATPPATLIDALPSQPGYVDVAPAMRLDANAGRIGTSPYTSNAVVTLKATYAAGAAGSYQFVASGGTASRMFVDGLPVTGAVTLAAGSHALEARFAFVDATTLPAQMLASVNSAAATAIPTSLLRHDETTAIPFLNSLAPTAGSPLGGEAVTIKGFGFFPAAGVVVHWGSTVLPALAISPTAVTIITPPGSGTAAVTIETPNGTSNAVTFTYGVGTVPVAFAAPQTVASPVNPTQAAWGPDGRLYVATVTGQIVIYTFDDNYTVTNTQLVSGVSGLTNPNVLGIAFNPFDPPSPARIYIAHSKLFANGGSCFTGPSAYSSQVSRLDGPNFTTVTPVVTGLPASNHDHAVNGLTFDNTGGLLIAVGGNTNAGVAGDCDIGQLPESPLSAAILKANVSKSGFNGTITYRATATGQPQNDQVFGETVDVTPGADVSVFASGFRNAYDLVLTTAGRIYAIDNGPNATFGPASTSATTQAADPTAPDEVVLVAEGAYYGHPNRNRGRSMVHENVYRDPASPPLLGRYTAPLTTLPSSSDGVDEYRATTFNSAMRGDLLVQELDGILQRVRLGPSGTAVTSVSTLATSVGLDVVTGPGGAIVVVDYNGSKVKVLRPNDAGAPTVGAYDIFPWRGRMDGTVPFVIGGVGFGTLANTTVTIGGVPATLTSVSPTRIRGIVPVLTTATSGLVDVVVQSAGATSTITRAFRPLLSPGTGAGAWQSGPALPAVVGEVAVAAINGVAYLVGEATNATFAFDFATRTWQSVASRPLVGNHHSAEVMGGKLYLFGGIGGGSEGRVQIYDPATDTWTLGATAPFATGSSSTALINGLVYMVGGIVGTGTVASAAVYNPATNTWASIAPMPLGRNHAAAGTDGRRLYVFGGRGPGSGDANVVADGFDDVQIYDPPTNTWTCSCTPGSLIPPLPQKRGGMGRAAYIDGEFYVVGGETSPTGTGQVAGNVYNRVDVYNPTTRTWRLDAAIPTARHGISPIAYDGKLLVAGGGTQAGGSESNVLEFFSR